MVPSLLSSAPYLNVVKYFKPPQCSHNIRFMLTHPVLSVLPYHPIKTSGPGGPGGQGPGQPYATIAGIHSTADDSCNNTSDVPINASIYKPSCNNVSNYESKQAVNLLKKNTVQNTIFNFASVMLSKPMNNVLKRCLCFQF